MYNIISTVNAATTSPILDSKMGAGDFITLIIAIFVLVAGIGSILYALYGSLLLVLSGGKDDKIKPALNTIRYSVIGVAITVLVIFVFPILGKLLGLDVEKYAKPEVIFNKIEDLGNKIFGKTSTNYNSTTIDQNLDNFPKDFSDL